MAKVYQIPTPLLGSVNIFPTPKFAIFGDDLATVTKPGYLSVSPSDVDAYPINPTDIIQAFYNFNINTRSGDFAIFKVSIGKNGVITLVETGGSGGSGTVDSGLANQLAYYAADGTTVEGLTSANSAVLITKLDGTPEFASLATNQVILGSSSDPFPATITAGSNISVTANKTAGTLTISAVGSGGSGTVNSGTTNQLAYYASNGDAVSGANLNAGSGISISNASGNITISSSLTPGLKWNSVSSTSQAMTSGNGYLVLNSSLTTLSLPATSAVGDVIAVQGAGAGRWTISQASSQLIRTNAGDTTTGTSGSMNSTQNFDVVYLICIAANTTWVYTSGFGNYNLI